MALSDVDFVFSTPRARLRPWTAADAPAFLSIYGDPEVVRFIGPGRPLKGIEVALLAIDAIERGRKAVGTGLLAVEVEGQVVGNAGIKPLEGGPDYELVYHFAKKAWGRGIATEVGWAWLRWGFHLLDLSELSAVVQPANTASRHVLKKLGFSESGMTRAYELDVALYRLSAEDYRWRQATGLEPLARR